MDKFSKCPVMFNNIFIEKALRGVIARSPGIFYSAVYDGNQGCLLRLFTLDVRKMSSSK